MSGLLKGLGELVDARRRHEEEVVELMRHTGWSKGAIEAAFVLSSEMAKTTMLSTQEIWRAFVRPMLVESWRQYMASQTMGRPR